MRGTLATSLARMRVRVAIVLALAGALCAPAAAQAGKIRSASDAIDAAATVPAVRAHLRGAVTGSAGREGSGWLVVFSSGQRALAVVELTPSGHATQIFTGIEAQYPLARGSLSGVGERKINALWAWLPLSAIFVLAFFDWRRPLRLLHLDVAAPITLGIPYALFLARHLRTSVVLVYVPLVYMLARMLIGGFRPCRRPGPLTRLPAGAIAGLTLALLAARIALGLADPHVLDVGYASAAGADRLLHGQQIYSGTAHFDTYGPVTYFAYVPFVLIFGFHPSDLIPAASQAAAITFELLTVAGLVVLGRRARIGWALALAWVACPFTGLALTGSSNDALLAGLVVWAFVALDSAVVSGVLIGLAGAAKFMPLLITPLLARGRWLVYGAAVVVTAVLAVVFLLPPGGVRPFYDATIGFQLHRFTPFSVWNQYPSLHWLQDMIKALGVVLAAAVAFVPRGRRSLGQTAALAAAVLITAQLPLQFWFYLYVSWFLPLYCLALFSEHAAGERPAASQP